MPHLDTAVASPLVRTPRGPSPSWAVRFEIARALGGMALLPVRVGGFLLARDALRAELVRALAAPAAVAAAPHPRLPSRPLTIFVSCAEASGEIHAVSLVRALRARARAAGAPEPRCVGLGGARLAQEGVELIGRPVERAGMGLSDPWKNVGYYVDLLRDAATFLRAHAPDVCVPVDSPALHVPLAHIAQRYRVPVAHFVTPQYWGWAPWRASGYRSAVDLALSILPFEPAWFEKRGIPVRHVGHPLLDALPPVAPAREDGTLVLLPGSRRGVVERNLPWMLAVARAVHERCAVARVAIVHEDRALEPLLREHVSAAGAGGFVEIVIGDLHTELARARAALTVSGTILIDLLHARVPSVVVYRLAHARETFLARRLLTVPWFSSVNLLANEEVFPEFSFHGDGPRDAVVDALARAYADDAWRARCRTSLERAARALGPPGAADRAAGHALALAVRATEREH
ncbi:MAG: lipid-A-disaccharide synthase [Planctomycetota bacterium]